MKPSIIKVIILSIPLLLFLGCGNQKKSNNSITLDENHSVTSTPTNRNKYLVFLDSPQYGLEPWMTDGTKEGTRLLKDINTKQTLGSKIERRMVNIGNTLYFIADDGIHGRELWKSNSTGTTMVQDIHVGTGSSNIFNLTKVNETLYFSADNGNDGAELWKYDGTEAVMVKDISTREESSSLSHFVDANGILYFTINNNTSTQLWKSEGVESSTVLVKEIRGGEVSPYIDNLTHVNDLLYFTVRDDEHGRELWKSDGTAEGTSLEKDIRIGSESSNISSLTAVANTLYFTADDGTGKKLWESHDGRTQLLGDLDVQNPKQLTNVNGVLFFTAHSETHGEELWLYSVLGPILIDINEGRHSSRPIQLIAIDNVLYFMAYDATHGKELWKFDLSTANKSLVRDISVGNQSSSLHNLINVNGILYFYKGKALWKSDGTEDGTVLVQDTALEEHPLDISFLTAVGESVYMIANDKIHGTELWKSDGSESAIVMVKDIHKGTEQSIFRDEKEAIKIASNYYFVADDGIHGIELWISDGTEEGTRILKNIQAGKEDAFPQNLRDVNGTLYFTAFNDTYGRELWKTNGTEEGTVIVKDINPNNRSVNIKNMLVWNNTLYFTVGLFGGDNPGTELWKSDGSHTTLVKQVGSGNYEPDGIVIGRSTTDNQLTLVNNKLYFSANDGVHGIELWKSDGSTLGTKLVKNINAGDGLLRLKHSRPKELSDINGVLYFSANDGIHGTELWKSDGTEVGTLLVKDLREDALDADPKDIANINGMAYFSAKNEIGRKELWKSDGTAEGTERVKLFYMLDEIDNLFYLNNKIYLTISTGFEDGHFGLWLSDGSEEGTESIANFNTSVIDIKMFGSFENNLLFRTENKYDQYQLWKTKETSENTIVLADAEIN